MQSCKCQLYIHNIFASFSHFQVWDLFLYIMQKGANALFFTKIFFIKKNNSCFIHCGPLRMVKVLFFIRLFLSPPTWCFGERWTLWEVLSRWYQAKRGTHLDLFLSSVCSPTWGVNIERAPHRVWAPTATHYIKLFMLQCVTDVQQIGMWTLFLELLYFASNIINFICMKCV